jgi:hypothetical protein
MLDSRSFFYYWFKRKHFDWSFAPGITISKALFFLLKYASRRRTNSRDAIRALLKVPGELQKAYRYKVPITRLTQYIIRNIRYEFWENRRAHSLLYRKTPKLSGQIVVVLKNRGIVLKVPCFADGQVVEKGVFLLKLGRRLSDFYHYVDVASLLEHYVLVIEDVWSGYGRAQFLYFTRFPKHAIIVMAPDSYDYRFLKNLETNLSPVNFGSCSWVDPSIFYPIKGMQKLYDAVMVAGWRMYKRHHVLFRAIRSLGDPSFRVALLARSWSGVRREIEILLDFYDIHDNIIIFENFSPDEVNKLLNQSKVNLLLSLKEGGNRSLSEGFMAGVPGIGLKNNIGIPQHHFNSQTGILIDEKDLGKTLLYFREHWTDFDPHPWAMENIHAEKTTNRLNTLLKDLANQRGEQWTHDIVAKCNAPNLTYYPNESVGESLPTMEDIFNQYRSSDLAIKG